MELFRVFDWDGSSLSDDPGGPLFVPRARQGTGRHDAPAHYGAWYCSRQAVGAVAEAIQVYRGDGLDNRDFVQRDGRAMAIVTLTLSERAPTIDLDDPRALVVRRIRPSHVATLRRDVTQRMAVSLFEEGAAGLSWWSTLNADWTNVTLFHERALPHTTVAAPPRVLSIQLPEVRLAAERLAIAIDA